MLYWVLNILYQKTAKKCIIKQRLITNTIDLNTKIITELTNKNNVLESKYAHLLKH